MSDVDVGPSLLLDDELESVGIAAAEEGSTDVVSMVVVPPDDKSVIVGETLVLEGSVVVAMSLKLDESVVVENLLMLVDELWSVGVAYTDDGSVALYESGLIDDKLGSVRVATTEEGSAEIRSMNVDSVNKVSRDEADPVMTGSEKDANLDAVSGEVGSADDDSAKVGTAEESSYKEAEDSVREADGDATKDAGDGCMDVSTKAEDIAEESMEREAVGESDADELSAGSSKEAGPDSGVCAEARDELGDERTGDSE